MTSEQPKKTPMQLAGEVARVVELENIALKSWSATYLPPGFAPPQLAGPVSLNLDHDVEFSFDRDERVLDLRVDFHLLGKDKEDGSGAGRVKFDVELLIRYRLREIPDLSDAHFKHFAELNGMMNAWPYIRQTLQDGTSRMGLPPLVLPLLKASRLKSLRPQKK